MEGRGRGGGGQGSMAENNTNTNKQTHKHEKRSKESVTTCNLQGSSLLFLTCWTREGLKGEGASGEIEGPEVQRWKTRDQIVSVRTKEEKEARQLLAGDEGGVCVHRERTRGYIMGVRMVECCSVTPNTENSKSLDFHLLSGPKTPKLSDKFN